MNAGSASSNTKAAIEFWIDVGGTFTDCFLRRADGTIERHKLLSSGITKGTVAAGSTAAVIVDSARQNDPVRVWLGAQLRLLDADGNPQQQTSVVSFDPVRGELGLEPPLKSTAAVGQPYELAFEEDAPLVAIRYLLGLAPADRIPPASVRLGTTRGTNALLTRRGARTALVTTKGFGDVLRIGYQNRFHLFTLNIEPQEPLYEAVMEIDERVTSDGTPIQAADSNVVRDQLRTLHESGIESLAICLLNAYAFDEHEQMVGTIAREIGFHEISLSGQVAPLVNIVSRGDTTVVDAYLNPSLRQYLGTINQRLAGGQLKLLTSSGGLVGAEHFTGKDSILSGPAGGVVGFSRVAQAAGFDRAIGFDMGGTSTDVSRFDGRYELEYETEKAGIRVVAPMMAIETVAAGGGSVCDFDGVKLVVGPDSAGADPGPACYGRGGPLSVTDLNFYLGKILTEHFPFPLDRAAVQRRLEALIERIDEQTGKRYEPHALCDGFLQVANSNMVRAIRSISIAKGANPSDYVLVAFGGAAGQHACAVARELNIREILIHPDAGILSAYGAGLANVVRHGVTGVYQPYSTETVSSLQPEIDRLIETARQEVLQEGVSPNKIRVTQALDLRYQGINASLSIGTPTHGDYRQAYEDEYRELYGYVYEDRPLEIVAARVEVVGETADQLEPSTSKPPTTPQVQRVTTAWFDGSPHETNVYDRERLLPGDRIEGPAIVHEKRSTTIIDPGWSAEVLSAGELLLRCTGEKQTEAVSTAADPVMLEVFNNQFSGIAEQMGITLRKTASSVNVKERLDYSCALFTPKGDLVVNAPHIPVHLGAMGQTVRQIIADNPRIRPGDVYVTNDPYRGGSHLPDITVITPVHDSAGERLLFFTASRAHHAEIGGIRPGSMPPFSKTLAEEGVLIRNFKLIDAGHSRMEELRQLLSTAPYPSRAVDDNLADIAAQMAANQQAIRDLSLLIDRYSLPVVEAYMGHIQQAAEQKMRQGLSRLKSGSYHFVDHLDNNARIEVRIDVQGDAAVIDFSGTDPVLSDNLNANRAIVTAAVLYVMRLLIDEEIPLNEGVLAPVEIILPECLLNPREGPSPEQSPAVVGGNVETSQRVVDVLLGALQLAAASQGTMNNLLFGDDSFGYYETICGGAGATPTAAGASAVHTHMTNTRLTDPEVLELRYPVRVESFCVRAASGGEGQHRGGDGVVRKIRFLKPLAVSILSGRREPYAPYGMHGGQPGKSGQNYLELADGTRKPLPARVQFEADADDVLVIETPGGGGYGSL